MKSTFFALLLGGCAAISFGYPAFLYASVNTSGILSGGVRWELNEDVCINGSLGAVTQEDFGYFCLNASALFLEKRFGPAITIYAPNAENADNIVKISGVAAFEKKVNDFMKAGISPTLLSIVSADESYVEILAEWNVYLLFDIP